MQELLREMTLIIDLAYQNKSLTEHSWKISNWVIIFERSAPSSGGISTAARQKASYWNQTTKHFNLKGDLLLCFLKHFAVWSRFDSFEESQGLTELASVYDRMLSFPIWFTALTRRALQKETQNREITRELKNYTSI